MSTWTVKAIERLGTPDVTWPTIWGPSTVPVATDPITANGLHTIDLTPYLCPLAAFDATLERDLSKSSFGSINLDLVDKDGSLAASLGPSSSTMGLPMRYFGPWIQITEVWSTGSALRWSGYVDETSIEWDEANAMLRFTALHASQLMAERLIADDAGNPLIAGASRPYPVLPTTASQNFTMESADQILVDKTSGFAGPYVARSNAAAIEAALWTQGQFSWTGGLQAWNLAGTLMGNHISDTGSFTPAEFIALPSSTIVIGGTTYAVAGYDWDTTIQEIHTIHTTSGGMQLDQDYTNMTELQTFRVLRVTLQGAPDLTGHLHLGDVVQWGIPETLRTHYVLAEGVAAPASGSDGQRYLHLTCVEQLVPGDVLSIFQVDLSSGAMRYSTQDVTIVDVDGERGWVWLSAPLSGALDINLVKRIRRNSHNPVYFDGVAMAETLLAPFALDTTYLQPADVSAPVVSWQSLAVSNPQLYGVSSLQTKDTSGNLRLARRGPTRETDGAFPMAGVWTGSFNAGFVWNGLISASSPLDVLGDLHQFPASSNILAPPVVCQAGDLSGGAIVPTNGWRHPWRTWAALTTPLQAIDSYWDGTSVHWTNHAAATTPISSPKHAHFAAQTAKPGRYSVSSGAWSFAPHTAANTLGSAVTPTITGSLPAGTVMGLGMGIYASGDEQEAILALTTTDSALPYSSVSAALLSADSSGNLTVRQTAALDAGNTAGVWAIGGGLVVHTYPETINGTVYPHTRLHRLNGTTVNSVDFKTLEIVPQSIQPLSLAGTAGSKTIAGYYAVGIETMVDSNYATTRHLRFLWLDSSLNVNNGDEQEDPSYPGDTTRWFSRGETISEFVPPGSVPCRLVRTGNGDEMIGMIGGRLFTINTKISTTISRLDITSLSATDYLGALCGTLLATAVPMPDGSYRLVSRNSGPHHVRTATTQHASCWTSEQGPRKVLQTCRAYLSEVRVSYNDAVSGSSATVIVPTSHLGGSPLQLDCGKTVGDVTAARAIGRAWADWFGLPQQVHTLTFHDRSTGNTADMPPTFWSSWTVGDLISLTPYTSAPTELFKITAMKRGEENRTVDVELLRVNDSALSAGLVNAVSLMQVG